MADPGVVAALQVASTASFVAIAAATLRNWLATRDRSGMYLSLAVGSLAAVSVIGQLGKWLGSGFTAVSFYLTIAIFLGSGLALLLFRDSVIPMRRATRRLVVATVVVTGLFEMAIHASYGTTAPKALQLIALVAFIAVWSGCVGEPSVRLWLSARRRTAVQRARMRALSLGYVAIIAILLAAVLAGSLAAHPAVQIGFALASIGVVPLLYAGFAAPAWLRRLWRQAEESKFQQATHDIVMYSPDQATLAQRALEWAVRLSGADCGYFLADGSRIVVTQAMTTAEAEQTKDLVAQAGGHSVVPLGGSHRRSLIIAPIPQTTDVMVLVGGAFTPVFGTDEQAWLRQYTSLVSTGLDRVRLVEAVKHANDDLEEKVREVVERTRQLEAANRELEAFSYTISHDLRAPLRAINGFTSIVLEEHAANLSAEALGYLRRVKDNGDHMGHLVDDLLAFSRLGRQGLRTQEVDTRRVVDRALAVVAPMMQGRQVEMDVADLPACEADASLLEQVFVNLLSNALKYSKNVSSARIEVGTRTTSAAEGPTFFVRDNGVGFDMAYADKLFGVFQRLHRSQDYEGTGVGLAIVHRIVERHGGRTWAESKVDQGATFYFTLKGGQEWQLPTAA